MPYFAFFLLELFLLAFLTGHSSSYFLRFFYSITRNEKASVILFSILFFPGTFIHELAHWLMAKLLFVHTSSMEFLPQIQGDSIKLGSVSIAKTDPLRRLLIGVAPVLVGLGLELGGLGLLGKYEKSSAVFPWWAWLLLGYLVFVIASTMFSSRKDLEGALGVVIAFVIVITILYFLGFGWLLAAFYTYLAINQNSFFQQLSLLMLIPLAINALIGILGWSATKKI